MHSTPDQAGSLNHFLSCLLWLAVAGVLLSPCGVTARGVLGADEKATIELFERSRNSVVYITTKAQVMDFWTRNVFSVPRGTGSGFIWDGDGHVVTNYHVIVDFKRPPAVPASTSRDLKVGQKVFAIGNPFGLDWTLTTGIVSALDRSLNEEKGTTIDHLIQTDAAINPGNSGGPLLDSAGELIGINTAIYSPSGANAGIGFAVPVDTVKRVVPQLIKTGKVVRPTLGIEINATRSAVNRRITWTRTITDL